MKKILIISIMFLCYSGLSQQVCIPSATNYLDTNNVRCAIFNSSDKWWDLVGGAQYEIPKGSGKNSLFTGSIWVGAFDQGNNLHLAAQTYRQGNSNDFFSGSVAQNSCVPTIDTLACINYNHVWNFKKAEIVDFINNGTTTNDILTYPANGNIAAGELPVLAPFYDINGNGLYEPALGDYPLMDVNNSLPDSAEQLFGDQCLYSIYNDTASSHTESNSIPLGIEVHEQAFAFSSTDPAINNATFYRYIIINRTCQDYDSVYIGHWVDPDLGDYSDDFVGCHVGKNLGYCYNGDTDDGSGTPAGYGLMPPVVGVQQLQGPLADLYDGLDNDHDGTTDEPGEEAMMSSFISYNNDFSTYGNPEVADDYYQLLSGSWKNGDHLTYDGLDGRDQTFPFCNYMFPSNSDPSFATTWTEVTAGNSPGDRRFLMSSGPFTLSANESAAITYAVLWARDTSINNASLDTLFAYADRVATMFDFRDSYNATGVITLNKKPEIVVSVFPNPATNNAVVSINGNESKKMTIDIYSIDGRLIEHKENSNNTFIIEKKNAGMYFYQLKNENSILYTGKIIFE